MAQDQPTEMKIYPEVDRRAEPDSGATFFLLTQVHDKLHDMDKKLSDHLVDETIVLAEEIAKLIGRAFPSDDPDGHRAYHEAQMRAMESKAKFWETMKTELAKWGLIGFCGFAAVALWKNFLEGPK